MAKDGCFVARYVERNSGMAQRTYHDYETKARTIAVASARYPRVTTKYASDVVTGFQAQCLLSIAATAHES